MTKSVNKGNAKMTVSESRIGNTRNKSCDYILIIIAILECEMALSAKAPYCELIYTSFMRCVSFVHDWQNKAKQI